MKINIFLLILFTMSLTVHGQTKQGVLIQTTFGPFLGWYGSHAGRQSIKVGINNVSKGSNTGSESRIEYDFFYVTDNPSIIECSGSTAGNYDNTDCGPLTKTIAYNKETFDSNSFGGCIADSDIMGIYLKPPPDETTICERDIVNLTRGWNWQYSYDGSTWVNFPSQFQEKRNISFKLTDLNGYDGKTKLFIHTGYQNQFTDFIIYDIIPCSPGFLGVPLVQNPRCSYSDNGEVTLTFDRELIGDEQYEISAIINNGPANSKVVTKAELTSPTTYTWKDLGAGIYSLKYNTEITINGIKRKTTVVPVPLFTITVPSAFSYELEYTDVNCTNGNDGTIAIKILTGVGPYKFYQDGIQVFPEFVMGKYYIKGLEAKEGGYLINVTGNGCIEKE